MKQIQIERLVNFQQKTRTQHGNQIIERDGRKN